jgi:hypothetical protein
MEEVLEKPEKAVITDRGQIKLVEEDYKPALGEKLINLRVVHEDYVMKESESIFELLSHHGDTKIIWDRRKPDEVEAAEELYDSLKAKRYLAFTAEGEDGKKGKQISKFDPNAERLIMTPPVVGG